MAERFIPAYAGNARDKNANRYGQAVHPRIRGERRVPVKEAPIAVGSSPHTRGTHVCNGCGRAAFRFIPAYAGNAECRGCACKGPTVHPRIRGERGLCHQVVECRVGSSPHTRGTHRRQRQARAARRFIPAYAGNAQYSRRPHRLATVHPRIRGERPPIALAPSLTPGSSPHTRGTRI